MNQGKSEKNLRKKLSKKEAARTQGKKGFERKPDMSKNSIDEGL